MTFTGTNPGGTGNAAKLASTNTSTITVVNGNTATTNANGDEADGVSVNNGSVTFTHVGSGDFVPVVFSADDSNNTLELNADGTPSEAFGVGQETTVVNAEAADASSPNGNVTDYSTSTN